MRTTAPSPTSNQPLGTGRVQWRRFFFHNVTLGVAGEVVFVLWMMLPTFQTARHDPSGHGHAMLNLKQVVAATGDVALGLLTFTR